MDPSNLEKDMDRLRLEHFTSSGYSKAEAERMAAFQKAYSSARGMDLF